MKICCLALIVTLCISTSYANIHCITLRHGGSLVDEIYCPGCNLTQVFMYNVTSGLPIKILKSCIRSPDDDDYVKCPEINGTKLKLTFPYFDDSTKKHCILIVFKDDPVWMKLRDMTTKLQKLEQNQEQMKELLEEIKVLTEENRALQEQTKALQAENKVLQAETKTLQAEIKALVVVMKLQQNTTNTSKERTLHNGGATQGLLIFIVIFVIVIIVIGVVVAIWYIYKKKKFCFQNQTETVAHAESRTADHELIQPAVEGVRPETPPQRNRTGGLIAQPTDDDNEHKPEDELLLDNPNIA